MSILAVVIVLALIGLPVVLTLGSVVFCMIVFRSGVTLDFLDE